MLVLIQTLFVFSALVTAHMIIDSHYQQRRVKKLATALFRKEVLDYAAPADKHTHVYEDNLKRGQR